MRAGKPLSDAADLATEVAEFTAWRRARARGLWRNRNAAFQIYSRSIKYLASHGWRAPASELAALFAEVFWRRVEQLNAELERFTARSSADLIPEFTAQRSGTANRGRPSASEGRC